MSFRASFVAAFLLVIFGACTTVGYIVYEATLHVLWPQFLTLNVFFWLLIYFSFGRRNRRSLWSWRKIISRYTIWYALCAFVYWYGFWVGLSSEGASLTIAILSLSMLITPLLVRNLESQERRQSLWMTITVGFSLLLSIFLIKINLNTEDLFNREAVIQKIYNTNLIPIVFLIVAVIAECIQDFINFKLPRYIDDNKNEFILEYSESEIKFPPAANDKINVIKKIAGREMILQSIPICLMLSVVFLLFHGNWSNFSFFDYGFFHYLSLFFLLMILGLFGSGSKSIIVAPLQQRKLHSETIPPLMVGRQIILFVGIYAFVSAFNDNTDNVLFNCKMLSDQKMCIMAGKVDIKLDIIPSGEFSFWTGIVIAIAIWVLRWAYFFKIGFFEQAESK